MAAEGDTRTLTYAQLAAITGLELSSARRLVFRKKWPRARGNDGLTRVIVPMAALVRHEGGNRPVLVAVQDAVAPPPAIVASASATPPTAAEVVELRERMAAAEVELRRLWAPEGGVLKLLREQLERERARADAAARQVQELRDAVRVVEGAATDARQQTAEATQRAEEATQRAEEARRRVESTERAAVEAWETARDLAQRLAAVQPLAVLAQAAPAPVRRRGWLGRLLGIGPAW